MVQFCRSAKVTLLTATVAGFTVVPVDCSELTLVASDTTALLSTAMLTLAVSAAERVALVATVDDSNAKSD